jgi:hypothetical protein
LHADNLELSIKNRPGIFIVVDSLNRKNLKMWVQVPLSLNGFLSIRFSYQRTFSLFMGLFLVSTGAIEYYNISRRHASNPKLKLNGNIFNKAINKVKSLFAVNSVSFA